MIRSYVYRSKEQKLERDVPFEQFPDILSRGRDFIWLDIEDKLDEDEVDLLTEVFGLHPIAVEDCIMVNTRPKIETYDNSIFVVIHSAGKELGLNNGHQVELNMFLNRQFLISVHQGTVRSITTTEDRLIRTPQLLAQGPDRLFHAIYDKLIDNYFPLMDKVDDEIESIEDDIVPDKILVTVCINTRPVIQGQKGIGNFIVFHQVAVRVNDDPAVSCGHPSFCSRQAIALLSNQLPHHLFGSRRASSP